MPKAKNLTEVIRVFDPVAPLIGEDLDDFYVDRQSTALDDMDERLTVAREDKPIKLLLTGQIGCGKSTELNCLAQRLKRDYFVVAFQAERVLSLPEINYVDVLLGMANTLFQQVTDKKLMPLPPAEVLGAVWEDVQLFFERAVFGDLPYKYKEGWPAGAEEVSAKINLMAVELETKFKTEGISREQIRKNLEPRLGELIEKINLIADQVRAKTHRPVLFMVEGTDKPDLPKARDMFLNHAESLTSPNASIIYTFPLDLRYSPDFRPIQDRFTETYFLPNMRLKQRDGSPNPEGEKQLTTILHNRMEETLIDPEARTQLIEASGGLTRLLIRLTQRAAVRAHQKGKGKKILPEHAAVSIEKERSDLLSLLTEEDFAALNAWQPHNILSGEPATQRLLRALALIEYRNGGAWCAVNPMLRSALTARQTPKAL